MYTRIYIRIRNFRTRISFFFTPYRFVKDHCCLRVVSLSFSIVHRLEGYITFESLDRSIGFWIGSLVLFIFSTSVFLLVGHLLSKCVQTARVVYS